MSREKVKKIRGEGWRVRREESGVRSLNFSLTQGINQAAILLFKFEIFPEEVELRQTVAYCYNELLSTIYDSPSTKGDSLAPLTPYLTPHLNFSASLKVVP